MVKKMVFAVYKIIDKMPLSVCGRKQSIKIFRLF